MCPLGACSVALVRASVYSWLRKSATVTEYWRKIRASSSPSTPAGSLGRCRTPNGPYHSAQVLIIGTPPWKKQPFDPSAPGTSPTPAPELIGTQARSAGWPMAHSFSWFSAVEEQPCRPTLPLDQSCALIQSRVSWASAVVV